MIVFLGQRFLLVALVIILAMAIMVLTVFYGSMGRFVTIVDAEMQCRHAARMSCESGGAMPPNWDTPFTVGGEHTSCSDIVDCSCRDGKLECASIKEAPDI